MARIALVGPTHPYKGGIAQHTTTLAHELSGAGHTVDLISWSEQYPNRLYPGVQRVPDGEPEVRPWTRTSYPLSWRRPDGWWRTGRGLRTYDLVVLVLVTPVQVPAYRTLLAALGGPPPRTVLLSHNVLPHERRAVDVAMVRAVVRRCDACFVHSAEQAALARELGARAVRTAPLPLALPMTDPAVRHDDEVRHRLLFFGLVRPYKGLDLLLTALARTPGSALTVAGEFWGGTQVTERLVRELGIADRVELRPGYVPAAEVPGLFARVDALVLPYRSATSSHNPDLAFEYGVPVVTTSAGALADRVRDGVDALVCAPGDVDALAAALARLYGEAGLLAALRRGVRPPDRAGEWARYVAALVDA